MIWSGRNNFLVPHPEAPDEDSKNALDQQHLRHVSVHHTLSMDDANKSEEVRTICVTSSISHTFL